MAALAGALTLGLAMVAGAAAQDATPEASPAAAAGHPGHIHSGTCETLGDVVQPLPNVVFGGAAGDMASPMASPVAGMGAASAVPAAAVSTTVDMALTDILAEDHAINYHESMENIQNYIACGAIGGTIDAQGNLFVGLAEQNDSGISGIAWLQEQGEETVVTVFLSQEAGAAGAMATPEA
jgi:hypothetical protein